MQGIEVDHVTLTIKKEELLHDVSVRLEKGLIHGIVGRNGSGKTLLFKCITGFMHYTSGQIRVDANVIGKDVDFCPDTGMIIETPGFVPSLSAYRNLKLLANITGTVEDDRVLACLEQVGLSHSQKPVKKYSLGMRQRLGIAQAIMEDPSYLILDEPFNGLDRQGVEEMRQLFLDLKQRGKTILMASHNREDIEILCDRVYEMDAGKLTEL